MSTGIAIIFRHMPFYQSALGEYEVSIETICLEYDIVTKPELARLIRHQ